MDYRIESITATELQAMGLAELGSSLNDALDAMLQLSKELQKAQERLAHLQVTESRCKSSGDAIAIATAKESIFVARAVVDNLKLRIRCCREIKSGLQTCIRAVSTI